MEEKAKKWKLVYGCWKGTISSRDSTIEECDSLHECREVFKKAEDCWRKTGYTRWGTCKVVEPDGNEVNL